MLNVIDGLVILLIICFLILIVKKFASKIKNAESYYVASRSIPFSLLVGTLVASWYGGPGLLNTVETAAVSGLAAWGIWCVGAHVARIPLALWVAPAVSMRTEMTIPQMLKKVYGKKVSFFMAIYMLITLLSISEIVALKNVVAGLFGESVTWVVPLILMGVVVLTIFGGMMGVAVTDMLLFFCMCFDCVCHFCSLGQCRLLGRINTETDSGLWTRYDAGYAESFPWSQYAGSRNIAVCVFEGVCACQSLSEVFRC